jgi:hypothetical protein
VYKIEAPVAWRRAFGNGLEKCIYKKRCNIYLSTPQLIIMKDKAGCSDSCPSENT